MISEQKARGHGVYAEISSDYTVSRLARLYNLNPTTSGLSVLLPDATRMKKGGPSFYVVNVGLDALTLKKNGGATLETLPSGDCVQVSCIDNSTAAGEWLTVVSDMTGVTPQGGGTGIVTLSAVMSIDTAFQSFLNVHGEVLLDAVLGIGTAFSGDITYLTGKEFSAQLAIGTAFAGSFAVFPATGICSPSATGTGDGTLGDPWTIKQAAAAVAAGGTVYLRGGTYARTADHEVDAVNETVNNGSSGSGYITYKNYPGETPTLLATFNIHNAEYLRFEGLHFHSGYSNWLTTSETGGTTNHIILSNCSFTSELGTNQWYVGLMFYSADDVQIQGCTFSPWHGGDLLRVYYGSDILIENCDFGRSSANHALIACVDVADACIRNTKFRNGWARCCQVRQITSGGPVLVENNVFIDSDWDGVSPPSGDPNFSNGSVEVFRLATDRIIWRNNLLLGSEGGDYNLNPAGYRYSGALTINLHDAYNEAQDMRVYCNVIYDSKPCSFAAFANPSAGAIETTGNRFRNNVFSHPDTYNIRLDDEGLDWLTWEFDTNLIYHPTNTTDIYILDDQDRTLSVADAESRYSTVFVNNIDGAPTFVDSSLLTAIDANPALMDVYALADFFDAFKLASGSGFEAGKEIAEVTASAGPTTTITVDDAYVFFAGNNWMGGDEIIIGTNDPVKVTAIGSATSITVDTSITVTNGDKIYLARMGTNPSVGVYPLVAEASQDFAATMSVGTAFSGALTYDILTLAAAMSVGTAFSGEITVSDNLLEVDHEEGDSSDYDSFVDGGGDLTVAAGAALNSTSYGLSAFIDSTDGMYGEKGFSYSGRYLRYRFYFDPNGFSVTSNGNVNLIDLLSGASLRGYVQLYTTTAGAYSIRAAATDDGFVNRVTGYYSISDAPHYIEVEIAYATSDVASDGHVKLWIDGTLKETRSSLDIYNISRSDKIRMGSPRNITAAMSGTLYSDELILRDTSQEIGA